MTPSATRGPESERRWSTPIRPPTREEMWCVFEQRGCVEWLVHPEKAEELMETGITLDGVHCKVTKVAEWPHVGRWQIMAQLPGANAEWIDAARA